MPDLTDVGSGIFLFLLRKQSFKHHFAAFLFKLIIKRSKFSLAALLSRQAITEDMISENRVL